MAKYRGLQGAEERRSLQKTLMPRSPSVAAGGLGQPLGQAAQAPSCRGRGWGQGGAGRVRHSAVHGSLPPTGKKHLSGLQTICEWGQAMATSALACRDPAYVFEMWSQAKQVTEPQKGECAFYSSPKYNLKPPNEGRFC